MAGQGIFWGKRRRRDSGAAAVEFALVLPVLIMLVFGIVTTGLAYSDHLAVTNAVREGARLGSNLDYASNPTAWADSVQTRVQQVYFNAASTLSTSQVCVQLVDDTGGVLATPTAQGTTCGTPPQSPTYMATGTCAVKVWVSKPETISIIVYSDMHLNIGAESVSYYGRTTGSCTAMP